MFAFTAISTGIAPAQDKQAGTSNLVTDAGEPEQPHTNQQQQPIDGVLTEMASLIPGEILHEYPPLLLQEASLDGHVSGTAQWGSTPNSINRQTPVPLSGPGNPGVMDALTRLITQYPELELVPPGDTGTGRLNLHQGQLMHQDNTVASIARLVSNMDSPELAELKIQLKGAAMQAQALDGKQQAQPGLLMAAIAPGSNEKTAAQVVSQADLAVDVKGLRGSESLVNIVVTGQPATIVNGPGETARGTLQPDGLQPASIVENQAAAVKPPGIDATPPAMRNTELPPHLQLAEAIRGQIGRDGQGSTHVRLQLQPESLGEVVIRLVYKDGNLSTHFHAATEGARQIIESSLGQLREALATHQLNLQHTTVSAGGEEGRWGQDWNHNRNFNRPNHQTPAHEGSEGETVPEPNDELKQPGALKRLNYFV